MALFNSPFTLKPLIGNVPLSKDDDETGICITCVDYWEGNLYIGTSAAEVLHFVSIPEDDQGESQGSSFILASRIEPSPSTNQDQRKGVQRIAILPQASRALILCNNTLTFHTLPELSPASNAPRPVANCFWVGGNDLDQEGGEGDIEEGNIMMALRTKMRVLSIGDKISQKVVDYPSCLAAARRDRFACVADSRSYALVDLENQQKIPLFPISSLDDTAISAADRQGHSLLASSEVQNSSSTRQRGEHGHGRNSSLGAFVSGLTNRQPDQRPRSQSKSGLNTPEPRSGTASPVRPGSSIGATDPRGYSPNRPLPSLPPEASPERASQQKTGIQEFLQPHILSPLPTEFLLLTGTSNNEPGVGIFVNLDGDVVRGTLEFSQFPRSLVIDGGAPTSDSTHDLSQMDSDGFVLAAIEKRNPDDSAELHRWIEIQRWDVTSAPRALLELPSADMAETSSSLTTVGVSTAKSLGSFQFPEIGNSLRSQRFRPRNSSVHSMSSDSGKETNASENARNAQEDEFASRLGRSQSRTLTWHDNQIFWATRNPLLLQVDSAVQQILDDCKESRLDQARLIRVMKSIRNHDVRSETEFLSLEYVRQKMSIILFADLAVNRADENVQFDEQLLMEAGADPRLILSLIPFLKRDIFEGPEGIWVHSGLVSLMQDRYQSTVITLEPDEVLSRPEDFDILGLTKRYLSAWRQRKGFGSIADEAFVFATVDAALLHVLLLQDQQSHLGPGSSSTVRAEIYSIVDNPVNCFERAVELLEEYRRLYVLSRLYQSRRMVRKVLETWRRILEGAPDDGGGFTDGENEVRKYLINRSDRSLVEDYGTWLAKRNPQLGVQIFTDEAAKVKFTPDAAVQLLRQRAPDAVKVYLEHLVFGKKHLNYANNLISYYLDSVISVLSSSQQALSLLSASYKDYRALPAPKPTYRQFITDKPIQETWWHDRLRLLELLGGSHGTGFSYDVAAVLARLEPYETALVPESIILEGQQGHHTQALHLLTHGLGDYHTAINYCLLGGASIFHPATPGTTSTSTPSLPTRDQQSLLFTHLLSEFLTISSPADRLERTSELLSRFAPWFDVSAVLGQIPNDWAIEAVATFLMSTLRKMVGERSEGMVVRALSGAENLRAEAELVEKVERLGPTIVPEMDTPGTMGSGGFGG